MQLRYSAYIVVKTFPPPHGFSLIWTPPMARRLLLSTVGSHATIAAPLHAKGSSIPNVRLVLTDFRASRWLLPSGGDAPLSSSVAARYLYGQYAGPMWLE
jgi:hypothetical protein